MTLSCEKGAVSGGAGCSMFHGACTVHGQPVATRTACTDRPMKHEREFLSALASAATWSIEGDTPDMHRADDQRARMAQRR
jgi:heat shock protein HslJ